MTDQRTRILIDTHQTYLHPLWQGPRWIELTIGEKGYRPLTGPDQSTAETASREISNSAVEATMFGWHTPAARLALQWAEYSENEIRETKR